LAELDAATPNIVWSELDNEVILLDTSSGDFYSLNETATEVWKRLESNDSVHQIATHLAAKYGIDLAQAAADVSELVEAFRTMKLRK